MWIRLRYWLRWHLTPRAVLAAVALLAALAGIAPWLPPYATLTERMERRHLEARGRSPEQIQQREAAARRAEDERARRQAADEEARRRVAETERQRVAAEAEARRQAAQQEAERRRVEEQAAAQRRAAEEENRRRTAAQTAERDRQERELAGLVSDFRQAMQRQRGPLFRLEGDLGQYIHLTAQMADDPAIFGPGKLSVELISTDRPCGNPPASPNENPDQRSRANVAFCAIHLARKPSAYPTMLRLIVALYWRYDRTTPHGQTAMQNLPVAWLVAYAWHERIVANVRRGEPPPSLPPLLYGQGINPNPALLAAHLPDAFSLKLFATATDNEILVLQREVYPDLNRMVQIGGQIVQACRTMQRTNCLDDA